MTELDYSGLAVIVTGAGGGIGRAHALAFAERGAKVVVNDIGTAADGTGTDASVAAQVVQEILDLGGEAVADAHSVATVEGGAAIVQSALDAFGRVDTIVSNAGILRDRTFAKLTVAELDPVLDVHLRGAFFVLAPAFRAMKETGGGRLVLTTSASGLFGMFGQANYAAAKMGLVGLTRVLAQEGAKHGIVANAVAPVAATRMSAKERTDEEREAISPARVSPLVVALGHPSCPANGEVFVAGGGWYSRVVTVVGAGWVAGPGELTAEAVADNWDAVRSSTGWTEPRDAYGLGELMERQLNASVGG